MKKIVVPSIIVLLTVLIFGLYNQKEEPEALVLGGNMPEENAPAFYDHPLSMQALSDRIYEGSELVVEEELASGSNYTRSIVSYDSEGNKQRALLTIPNGDKPETGWPVIIFNHGYITPSEYRTTERYIAYTDVFSRNGYMLIRPDYRGHDQSEGVATGGYSTNDYTVDVLNALASIKRHPDADPDRIGMWGHSMGGHITLDSMVVREDVKAGVIWAGVVASYPELLTQWTRGNRPTAPPDVQRRRSSWRQSMTETYGTPEEDGAFWKAISPTALVSQISGPVQLHHGTGDTTVPYAFSESLEKRLLDEGKTVELYLYEGDDHNIANNFSTAANRSVEFFDKYVKGTDE